LGQPFGAAFKLLMARKASFRAKIIGVFMLLLHLDKVPEEDAAGSF
jgi:hypothetical protein